MTIVSFAIVAKYEPDATPFILTLAVVFGFLLPIAVFIYMRKKKLIVDDDATIKEERTLPYIIGILLTFTATIISYFILGAELSTLTWIVYVISSTAITIINKYWKISAHAMGVSIPLGISIVLGNMLEIPLLIVLLVIFWSRLKLKVHTPLQLFAGALLGSLISIIILMVASYGR